MRYMAWILVSLLITLLVVRSAAAACGERWDFLFEDYAGTHADTLNAPRGVKLELMESVSHPSSLIRPAMASG